MDDIFDDPSIEMPVLAISPEKAEKTRNGSIKIIGGKKLKLKRGITTGTGAQHNVMPKCLTGKQNIRPSPGSRRGMRYVAAGNERIKNEGEITFDFESLEGHKETLVFQIAAVNKALGSGAYIGR